MTGTADLKEFISAYLVEAEEHLAVANSQLLAIEAAQRGGGVNPRAVRETFRSLHTIKGLSAMVGVEPIVALAHRMESFLRDFDRSGAAIPLRAIDALLRGVQAIEQRVAALAQGESTPAPSDELITELDSMGLASAPIARTPESALDLDPAILGKLAPFEVDQILRGVSAGKRALRAGFNLITRTRRGWAHDQLGAWAGRHGRGHRAEGLAARRVDQSRSAGRTVVRFAHAHRGVGRRARGGGGASTVCIPRYSTRSRGGRGARGACSVPKIVRRDAGRRAVRCANAARRRSSRCPSSRRGDGGACIEALIVKPGFVCGTAFRRRTDRSWSKHLPRALSDYDRERAPASRPASGVGASAHGAGERTARASAPSCPRVAGGPPTERCVSSWRGGTAELDKIGLRASVPRDCAHLVRNAVDHAIETPDERVRRGKPEEGLLRITCGARSNTRLEITVSDDGRGIDRAAVARKAGRASPNDNAGLLDLLCIPGLSTRDVATTTSGRGMGMEIVKRTVVDELGGELEVSSELGAGTTFTLRVPLTISIVDAFSFECGEQRFVVPVAMVDEIIEVDPSGFVRVPANDDGNPSVDIISRRGVAVPMIQLAQVFRLQSSAKQSAKAIIVRRAGAPIAFAVDRMLGPTRGRNSPGQRCAGAGAGGIRSH